MHYLKTLGYEFHCKHCRSIVAIDENSKKIDEVRKDGDVLICCPFCHVMELYFDYNFRELKDISEWNQDIIR